MLTSTQEDYIEIVFRRQEKSADGVRVTDLADALRCRLPTVTRTVQALADAGYFDHKSRGLVRLTRKGHAIARDIAHRHDDVVDFLHLILGLTTEDAEADACQIEHGLSPLASERLHAFLNYVEQIPARVRRTMSEAVKKGVRKKSTFPHLEDIKAPGWRR